MMYWHVDASYYPATITAFDELHYVHRVEHDDGDIEPAVKLWEVQVQLMVRIHLLVPSSSNFLKCLASQQGEEDDIDRNHLV